MPMGQGGIRAAAQNTGCLTAQVEKKVSSRQKEAGFRDNKQFKSVMGNEAGEGARPHPKGLPDQLLCSQGSQLSHRQTTKEA